MPVVAHAVPLNGVLGIRLRLPAQVSVVSGAVIETTIAERQPNSGGRVLRSVPSNAHRPIPRRTSL